MQPHTFPKSHEFLTDSECSLHIRISRSIMCRPLGGKGRLAGCLRQLACRCQRMFTTIQVDYLRRRLAAPIPAKPASINARADGSGTEVVATSPSRTAQAKPAPIHRPVP